MKPQRLLVPAAAFVLASTLAGLAFWHSRFFNDDALITIRYAENLVAGDGLVYNAGERHLGTTTPLWCLVLAAVGSLGVAIPTAATALGVLCFGWLAAATTLLVAERGRPETAQLFAALLVATSPVLVVWSGSGMEAPFFVAQLATFLWFYEREQLWAVGVLGGTMLLTRPESGLVLAAGAILFVVRKRSFREAWKVLPGFLIVVLPWLVAAGMYYGSPLPNSGFAKRLQVADWGTYASRLWRTIEPVSALLPFALVGMVERLRDPARALPAWALVVTVAGMHFGGLPGCAWYMVPPVYLGVLLTADGVWCAVAALSGDRAALRTPVAVALLCGVMVGHIPLIAAVRNAKRDQFSMERLHGAIGNELRRIAPPDATVGVDNIGYIGYRSGLRVVDMMGLVDREIVGHLADGELDYALRSRKPEYIAIWVGRGATWKYTPPVAWFDENGYETVFRSPVDPNKPDGPAYTIFSRIGR